MALLLLAAKLLAGTKGIFIVLSDFSFQRKVSFFQPGLLFIIGTIVLYFSAKERRPGMLRELVASTALKLPVVFGTIACLAVLARLLSQFLSVSDILPASGATHPFLLYTLALATGFAGSFMAGSATVSNLLFGTQWYQAGLQMQLPVSLLLACQLAGAAMGNALSIQNIAMVQAVLHQEKMDAQLLKILWKPVVLLLMGIVLATWLVSLCVV
jgi:lactate permease